MSMTGFLDQRRHKRFRAKEGMFTVLRDNGADTLGTVLDISRGGLAYRYVPKDGSQGRCFELDIFLSGEGYRAERLPFRTITDFEIDQDVPFSTIRVRRSGVQFGSLTGEQINQVENVIKNDTIGEATSQ